MQSFRQYRRICAAVEEDLAQSKHSSATAVNAAWPKDENATDPESENKSPLGPPQLPGVTATRPTEDDGANWTLSREWAVTFAVCLLNLAITLVSSIDASVALEFNSHYDVDAMAGSMTTGMYLIGSGVGALLAGTVSETFCRNVVYMTAFVVFMLFVMAKALAPEYGGAIVFRFLTGFFGSTPLTAVGGTIADVWSQLQLIYAIPFGAITSYAGPLLGPIVGAYLLAIGFRWADWVSLIFAGAVLVYVFLLQPETYQPVLLEWRASHIRQQPFILNFTFYLTVVYFVLFTFLNGYPFIFQQTYSISQSLTFILWTALLVGDFLALPLFPLIYGWSKKAAAAGTLTPEICLWYGMLGGSISPPHVTMPSVNIWVPIIGSVFFGYGLVTIFTATFLYTVFVYQRHTASALAFLTCVRYVVAGALIPASVPMYERLAPHRALTIPAVLATILAPVPFVLYKYGAKVRGMSKITLH
ncbi:hypothetical protein PG996_004784 [Apiospora saccharicola]|uniref:Major facilitator superfamily (MFS) profile domain-containing protein n=1 Tax=Apiospora saccharicola TaxID=335842 RepID=A0ABR1W553_9PEZI